MLTSNVLQHPHLDLLRFPPLHEYIRPIYSSTTTTTERLAMLTGHGAALHCCKDCRSLLPRAVTRVTARSLWSLPAHRTFPPVLEYIRPHLCVGVVFGAWNATPHHPAIFHPERTAGRRRQCRFDYFNRKNMGSKHTGVRFLRPSVRVPDMPTAFCITKHLLSV